MSEPVDSEARRLGQRILRGSLFVNASYWVSAGLNFGIGLALARILGPEAFGFYAFVFAINELLNVIGAFGLPLAVLQAREGSQSLYDTAYAASAVLAGVALSIALLLAPFLVAYRSREAAWFVVSFGLFRVLSMLSQIQMVRLERELRYGVVAAIGFVIRNVPSLSAVAFALLGGGVWSLLLRDGLAAALAFILTFLASGYRYRGEVQRGVLGQIMTFSGPLFLARSIEIAFVRVDRILVGYFLGNRALGFYHQALALAETSLIALEPLNQLTFNLYARLQGDTARLARAYQLVNTMLARLVCCGAVTLVIFPEQTIRLLLGEQWLGAAPVLRWLGVYAALLPIEGNMKTLLLARARVRSHAKIRFVQLCLVVPGITAAGLRGSIEGVAAALVGTWAVGVVLSWLANGEARGEARAVFGMPLLCSVLTVAGFGGATVAGVTTGLPWAMLPFLPPIVFAALLLLFEGRRLSQELGYLRRQLRPVS